MRENTATNNAVLGDSMAGYQLYSTISSYQHLVRNKYKHNYSKLEKMLQLEEKVKQWTMQLYHTY